VQEAPVNLDWLKWDAKGLVSVIFQDCETKDVLTLAYMNKEALQRTVETGKVHVFRRSHGKVMAKGEQSGRYQVVKEICLDCDGDALVMLVEQIGGAACHEGYRSCFFRKVKGEILETIGERVFDPKEVYKR
jgi:phosphoribosyl-AMP cyclohydrolase